jgi:hypothetical protein
MHRDFWPPYAAERNGATAIETVSLRLFDTGWLGLRDAVPVFLELYMICVCALLDKKYHRVRTGRKFFTAELSSARSTSE